MTRLRRMWQHWCCTHGRTHHVDWVYAHMTGHRRCIDCQTPMPRPDGSCLVGDLNPSVGD